MMTLSIPTCDGPVTCEVQILGRRAELPVVYPDAYIDYWAEIWSRNRALMPHVSLLAFLLEPRSILRHYLQAPPAADREFEPLLPAQQEVADRIQAEELVRRLEPDNAVLRDRRLIEPLHHHAHGHRPSKHTGQGGTS